MDKTCRNCKLKFSPTSYQLRKADYQCAACRKKYESAWRAKRRAAGLPAGGKTPPEWLKGYLADYYARPEIRTRRSAAMRRYAADPRLRPRHQARLAVRRAIESGRLIKEPCEKCGSSERVHAHHDDYAQPLVVRWLCPAHHREVHKHAKAEGRQP